MNNAIAYIENCRENIRALNTEYEQLLIRQKREPNPHRKAQIKREINAVKCELTANYDEIQITKENMHKAENEVLIDLPEVY